MTARALESVLNGKYLVSVLPIHRILGTFDYVGEQFYNFCLTHRMIRLIGAYHELSKKLIRLYRPVLFGAIKRFFSRHPVDCIVSCIPWVNHYFIKSLPQTKLVTVISDFCDSSTHPWIQHKKQHLICPTETAAGQARAFGLPEDHIYPVSGNIISSRFYDEASVPDREKALIHLGLDPKRKTALLFYGGYGPNYLDKLIDAAGGWNRIVIWGENPKRVERPGCVNLGFTYEIPYYMRISDLLIGKPGPGVIAEAVHCNLPILVDAGRGSILPQEEDVLEWIIQSGLGSPFRSFSDFTRQISSISDKTLSKWRDNAGKITNNALFEAAEVIERIVDGQ